VGTIAWELRASGLPPAPGQAQGDFRAGTQRGMGGCESRGRFGTAGAEAGCVGTRESRESEHGNSVGGQIGWSSKKKLCHKIKLDP
jgi:hypothetical protein